MPDHIQIFKPGFRVLDANGDPVSGAKINVWDAGLVTPRTVYSDLGLSTSLGAQVICNSSGIPTSDGNSVVEIYTGTTAYGITITDSADVLIPGFSWDNITGAFDTSSFLTDPDITPSTPVTNTSSNQTPANADKGKFYNVDCSGGDVSVTIADAAGLDNGWFIKVRHDGSANQVLITTASGTDLLNIPGHPGVTDAAMTERGQVFTITSDSVGFNIEESSPSLTATVGRILIVDRLSTPPGSPEAGARYILTAAPTGVWASFAEHDIAESDGGGGWFVYTPASDAGWIAYVQDEDRFYTFKGTAWFAESNGLATQADMETATDTEKTVTPGVQHFHPGHPKFWAMVTVSAGTPTLQTSYNVTSITDTAVGRLTVTIATDFSTANWCCQATVANPSIVASAGNRKKVEISTGSLATGSVEVSCWDSQSTPALSDPESWHVSGQGDHA